MKFVKNIISDLAKAADIRSNAEEKDESLVERSQAPSADHEDPEQTVDESLAGVVEGLNDFKHPEKNEQRTKVVSQMIEEIEARIDRPEDRILSALKELDTSIPVQPVESDLPQIQAAAPSKLQIVRTTDSQVSNMAIPVDNASQLAMAQSGPELIQDVPDLPQPTLGRGRRVKTRLLGFEHSSDSSLNPLAAVAATLPEHSQAGFPVGWIVVVGGPGRGNFFTLYNGVSQIGRGKAQAIKLDYGDNSISRSNHAAIAYDHERKKFYLGHGGKTNLVRLNNAPVLSTEELSTGDLINIGETVLRFVSNCGEEFDWGLTGEEHDAAIE